MPQPYTHTSLINARTALAARLEDPAGVYWAVGELDRYVVEALRTWQAFTAGYRERGQFGTAVDQAFYDLPAVLPSLAGYTVTDRDTFILAMYHLLEPAVFPYAGTDQFTEQQVLGAIERRRNQFLLDTGCVVTRDIVPASPPANGRVDLPQEVIDVRRAAWRTLAGVNYVLWRDNEWRAETFIPGWPQLPTQLNPYAYSVSVTPPVSLQLIPPPVNVGNIDLVSVKAGAALSGFGVLLGVPDDFAWAVKFGALADILSGDGQAQDPIRAAYCEQRYQEGVAAARINPSVLQTQLNAVPVFSGAIEDLDIYRQNWQNQISSVIDSNSFAGMAGRNLLAIAPLPHVAMGVTVDIARNMPVPANPGDFLQVGEELVDVMLDYAQHLAMFKTGGAEWQATMQLRDNFMRKAVLANSRLRAASFNKLLIEQPAYRPESLEPRVMETA